MERHLFIVNRQHQLHCCNRYIKQNNISNYKIIYFFKEIDTSFKEASVNNTTIIFYSFQLLNLLNFSLLYKSLNKFKCDNIYIGDPYFYRYYTLAFLLLKNRGKLFLLDDGNTSLTLIISMKYFFSRLNFNKLIFYFFKKVKIEYDGYFLKDLKKIKTHINKKPNQFNKVLVFGTSISTIGQMESDTFLNMLRNVFSNFADSFKIIYYPHPNEETYILNEFVNIKIDKQRTLLKSLNSKSENILFLTFSSSMSIELALSYPDCVHKIIPISKFIEKPKWLKREFADIENLYFENDIKFFC